MRFIKEKRTKLIEKQIELRPSLGDDVLEDHNNIETVLIISFTLKTLKLFVIIITFSFFFAMLFKVILEIEHDLYAGVEVPEGDIYYDPNPEVNECDDPAIGYFTKCFELGTRSNGNQLVLLLYYSFTSLSTVGFGDFYPRSNLERLMIAFFLLFGVAIFSYIMGIFIEILNKFQDLTAVLDDGEQLNSFMNIIKKFNMG